MKKLFFAALLAGALFSHVSAVASNTPVTFQIDRTLNPSPVCVSRQTSGACTKIGTISSAGAWTPNGPSGAGYAPSAYIDTTNANNITSGTVACAREPTQTGDVSSPLGSCVFTLATVNSNVGTFGSSTAIPVFVVNGKGLVTGASTAAVVAPAVTLTGSTLAAGVVNSSLTSVGTITTGTWQGTPLDPAYLAFGAAAANVGTLGGDLTGTLPSPTVATGAITSAKLASGAAASNLGAALGTSGATIPLNNSNNAVSGNNTYSGTNAFSVSPTVPTAALSDNSTKAASTAFVIANAVSTVSPAFTGTPTAPTAAPGTNTTQLATTAFVQTAAGVPNISFFNNLKVTNGGTPNTQVTVTADALLLKGTSAGFVVSSVNVTASSGLTGANGLDTGTVANATWYAVWVISNGSTTAGLLSTSFTAPTMPGGYTFKTRVGSVQTDGSAAFYRFVQYGRRASYVITAATNTATYPLIAGASVGASTAGGMAAVAISGFAPPTTSSVSPIIGGTASATNGATFGPSNNYGAYNASVAASPPPAPDSTASSAPGVVFNNMWPAIVLQSTNVYAYTQANSRIYCEGYEDNL